MSLSARTRACIALAMIASPVLGLAGVASGAAAPSAAPVPEDLILLSGSAEVPRGTSVGQVVVLHGSALVEGVARGDVVVVTGHVLVTGQVSGSVVNLDGPVTVGSSAQIRGDVLARTDVRIREGARIEGEVRHGVPFSLRWLAAVGALAAWLAVAVSAFAVGLLLLWLAPRATEAVMDAARSAALASVGWGAFWLVAVPLLAFVSIATLFLLPLGLSLLLALWLLLSVGYSWSGWVLGRRLLGPPRPRVVSLLAGLGGLTVVSAIPWVGGVVWLLASGLGLGSATVAAWRARGIGGKHRRGGGQTVQVPDSEDVDAGGPPVGRW